VAPFQYCRSQQNNLKRIDNPRVLQEKPIYAGASMLAQESILRHLGMARLLKPGSLASYFITRTLRHAATNSLETVF
jgi:hypothetical protein